MALRALVPYCGAVLLAKPDPAEIARKEQPSSVNLGLALVAAIAAGFQLDLAAVENAALGGAASAYQEQQHAGHDLQADLSDRSCSPAARTQQPERMPLVRWRRNLSDIGPPNINLPAAVQPSFYSIFVLDLPRVPGSGAVKCAPGGFGSWC